LRCFGRCNFAIRMEETLYPDGSYQEGCRQCFTEEINLSRMIEESTSKPSGTTNPDISECRINEHARNDAIFLESPTVGAICLVYTGISTCVHEST